MKIEPQFALCAVDFSDSFFDVLWALKDNYLPFPHNFYEFLGSIRAQLSLGQRIHEELNIFLQKFSIQCLIKSKNSVKENMNL